MIPNHTVQENFETNIVNIFCSLVMRFFCN